MSTDTKSRELYISGIPIEANIEDMNKLLGVYGPVSGIRLKPGFAFAHFEKEKDASDFMTDFHGREILGATLVVQYALQNKERTEISSSPSLYYTRSLDHRVVVTGLSKSVGWQDLKDFGRTAGRIAYADIDPSDSERGIIEYTSKEDAAAAARELDRKELRGHKVRVTYEPSAAPKPIEAKHDSSKNEHPGRHDSSYPTSPSSKVKDAPRSRSGPSPAPLHKPRAPSPTRSSNYKVTVTGLSNLVGRQDLIDFGRAVGRVAYADIDHCNSERGIMEYTSKEDAAAAARELDRKELRGHKVRVTYEPSTAPKPIEAKHDSSKNEHRSHRDSSCPTSPSSKGKDPPRSRSGPPPPPPKLLHKPRSPSPTHSSNHRVTVTGLSNLVGRQDLIDFGRTIGRVVYADTDPCNSERGIIEYTSKDDTATANRELDGKVLRGCKVRLIDESVESTTRIIDMKRDISKTNDAGAHSPLSSALSSSKEKDAPKSHPAPPPTLPQKPRDPLPPQSYLFQSAVDRDRSRSVEAVSLLPPSRSDREAVRYVKRLGYDERRGAFVIADREYGAEKRGSRRDRWSPGRRSSELLAVLACGSSDVRTDKRSSHRPSSTSRPVEDSKSSKRSLEELEPKGKEREDRKAPFKKVRFSLESASAKEDRGEGSELEEGEVVMSLNSEMRTQ